jgi:ubiquitin carboxyl-terminal hydrolase 7
MIEGLKAKQSLKTAELQDGDIICVQRKRESGTPNFLEKRLGGDARTSDES